MIFKEKYLEKVQKFKDENKTQKQKWNILKQIAGQTKQNKTQI